MSPLPPIQILAKMLPHQREPLARLWSLRRSGRRHLVDGSDTGTGKTFVASALASGTGCPVAVLAPLPVLHAWEEALARFHVKPSLLTNYEKLNPKCKTRWLTWLNSGWPAWHLPDNCFVIVDEAHRCKGEKTNAALLLASLKFYNVTTLSLSATLAESPLDLRALGFLHGLHGWNDFAEWCTKHGCADCNGWRFIGGPEHLAPITRHFFRDSGVRVRRSEIEGFPPTKIVPLEVDAKGAAGAWKAARDAAVRAVDLRTAEWYMNAQTEILKARMAVEASKLPALASIARGALDEGASVAVFVNFTNSVQFFRQAFPGAGVIWGGPEDGGAQKPEERAAVVREFREDRLRLVVCNIAAGGVGISLHGRRPRVSIISPPWSAMVLRQALGRVARAGGSHSTQYIVFARDSIEHDVYKACQRKADTLDTLQDFDLQPIHLTA